MVTRSGKNRRKRGENPTIPTHADAMPALPRLGLVALIVQLSACAILPTPMRTLGRAQGYAGPALAEKDVAVVYATDAGPNYAVNYICTVDDQALEPRGCANVVYLKPGRHLLGWEHRSSIATGSGKYPVTVEAGRVYQLNASYLTGNSGLTQVIPLPQGARLSYRQLAPNKVPPGTHPDDPVPYGAN